MKCNKKEIRLKCVMKCNEKEMKIKCVINCRQRVRKKGFINKGMKKDALLTEHDLLQIPLCLHSVKVVQYNDTIIGAGAGRKESVSKQIVCIRLKYKRIRSVEKLKKEMIMKFL